MDKKITCIHCGSRKLEIFNTENWFEDDTYCSVVECICKDCGKLTVFVFNGTAKLKTD